MRVRGLVGRVAAVAFALAAFGLVAGLAAAASPVTGSIVGPVVSAKGTRFVMSSTQVPKGRATVSVTKSTVITRERTVKAKVLKKGVCVVATGRRDAKGTVAADQISVSQPVKGQCGGFFGPGRGQGARAGRPGGQPPATTTRPSLPRQRPPGSANFGFAAGAITAVKGSTITVHDQRGSATVTFTAKTRIVETARVAASAIKPKLCAFVRGTSSDKGVTVTAQDVRLFEPVRNGCATGFRPRG